MDIFELNLESDLLNVFPIFKELRPNLSENSFLNLLKESKIHGYKLLVAREKGEDVALMGYKIMTDFVHGKHLYIDDLVVTESKKGMGFGKAFLAYAEELARQNHCALVRLSTGADHKEGKEFYEHLGWDLRAVTYKKFLNSDIES